VPIVTVTTDYGTHDHYAGALKGVILGIAPTAQIVDITHDIEPHNVLHGAFVLRYVLECFPAGTIHVVVVDPGVGTVRGVLAGRFAGRYVIAPDNGLITLVYREVAAEAIHVVEEDRFFLPRVSATFHGRDILAPVAGHLANGVDVGSFGRPIKAPKLLSTSLRAENKGKSIAGAVLHVDRFGTLITNIGADDIESLSAGSPKGTCGVFVNGARIGPIRGTFADVAVGEAVAVVGGCDLLEIAVNQGKASERFGPVDRIRIEVR